MSEYERIEYRGHEIVTGFEDNDLDIFNPRDNDGNIGVMHCAHRRYDLGDEQTDPESMTVECPVQCGGDYLPVPTTAERVDGYRYKDAGWIECPYCDGTGEQVNPVQWAVEQGATVVLGLYLYDHSGITMRAVTLYRDGERVEGGNPFHCRWDSGMVGITFDTPEGIAARFAKGRSNPETGRWELTGDWHTEDNQPPSAAVIEECLHSDVKVYDDYLTGDIMWYRVEGPVCDDGCGGFFPDEKDSHAYMIDEAKAAIDSAIRHETEQVEKIGRMMAL